MGRKAKWKPLELPFARKTENPKQITFLGGLLMSAAIKDLQDAGGDGGFYHISIRCSILACAMDGCIKVRRK